MKKYWWEKVIDLITDKLSKEPLSMIMLLVAVGFLSWRDEQNHTDNQNEIKINEIKIDTLTKKVDKCRDIYENTLIDILNKSDARAAKDDAIIEENTQVLSDVQYIIHTPKRIGR